jgi:hypothetical protein
MGKSSTRRSKANQPTHRRPSNLYTLEVTLARGPISRVFARNNPVVARTVQMHGKQTLEDLHRAIFTAFGRRQEQMYEFQFREGASGPLSQRYVLPGAVNMVLEGTAPPAGKVTETTLDALALKPGRSFAYWFDFVADWWHQIQVQRIEKKLPRGQYPRITKRIGANPPQQGEEPMDPEDTFQNISGDAAADMSCLIGEMHLRKADYTKAIEAFGRAIEVRPTADAFLGRAKAYRALAARDETATRGMG